MSGVFRTISHKVRKTLHCWLTIKSKSIKLCYLCSKLKLFAISRHLVTDKLSISQTLFPRTSIFASDFSVNYTINHVSYVPALPLHIAVALALAQVVGESGAHLTHFVFG